MANHSALRRSPARAALCTAGTAASALVTLSPLLGATVVAAPADAATDPNAEVLQLTNAQRMHHGCAPLARDAKMDHAAQGYASTMSSSGTFSHHGPDGSSFEGRIRGAGYPLPGGENIAEGQDTPEQVVNAWMKSPGHRRNILDCTFRTIGVGHTTDDYWVQDFGR